VTDTYYCKTCGAAFYDSTEQLPEDAGAFKCSSCRAKELAEKKNKGFDPIVFLFKISGGAIQLSFALVMTILWLPLAYVKVTRTIFKGFWDAWDGNKK